MDDNYVLTFTPFEPGMNDYKISESIHYRSKSGNESIRLTVDLTDNNGAKESVKCYLSARTVNLIKGFCVAHGLKKQWEDRALRPSDCFHKSGKCKTYYKKDDKGRDQLNIAEFCKADQVQTNGYGMTEPVQQQTQMGPAANQQNNNDDPFL